MDINLWVLCMIVLACNMMQRAYARLHQHDVRAKHTKVCDAERTGFQTPAYASIEAKRNLVTSRQRRAINYLQPDGQTSLTAVSRPSMMPELFSNG